MTKKRNVGILFFTCIVYNTRCQPISLLQLLIHSYVQFLANELTSKEPDIKRTKQYYFSLEYVK